MMVDLHHNLTGCSLERTVEYLKGQCGGIPGLMAGQELPLPDLVVAQSLRVLAALADNMGSVPSTHCGSQQFITSVPGV